MATTKPKPARYKVVIIVSQLDGEDVEANGLNVTQTVPDAQGFVDALAVPLKTANMIASRLDSGTPPKAPEKKKPGRGGK
jgi:hypothetical protein